MCSFESERNMLQRLVCKERMKDICLKDHSLEETVKESCFKDARNAKQFLSEETLKAGVPFYLVSMPGEVKDATQGVNV